MCIRDRGIGHVCPHGKHRIEHQDTLLGRLCYADQSVWPEHEAQGPGADAVSYTHLDVYKRQEWFGTSMSAHRILGL